MLPATAGCSNTQRVSEKDPHIPRRVNSKGRHLRSGADLSPRALVRESVEIRLPEDTDEKSHRHLHSTKTAWCPESCRQGVAIGRGLRYTAAVALIINAGELGRLPLETGS